MRVRARRPSSSGARTHSEAILIEASVAARLLGLRLLTLDATITLVPADVAEPAPAKRVGPARAVTRERPSHARHPRAIGSGLPDAVRTIGEGEQLLAKSRLDGDRVQ